MKVFISSDMEGAAGVVDWSQCREPGPAYELGCALLADEVNAAIEGALAGGATEILVNDSHGAMANMRPGSLAGDAGYLSGRHKPLYMTEGLDPTFDVAFFVAYHGSMGSSGTLSHTYNPRAVYAARLNGVETGESGINALVTMAHAVRRAAAGDLSPATVDLPARLEVDWLTADMAEMATWVRGIERCGGRTTAIVGDEAIEVYRRFVASIAITRSIVEL